MKSYKNIDEYIENFSGDEKAKLQELRKLLNSLIKNSEEVISYGIPTIKLNKTNIVHFAGYKTHVGFYPGALAIKELASELDNYETSKGTVKLPWDKKLPKTLITKIVKFNLKNIK